ncbi:MAG: primosomal protein N' [Planctomycetes bacterium]|nr:primosomal protein N' [Planctomycetota bacterium]
MTTLFTQQQAKIVGFARVAVERSVDQYPDGLVYAVPEQLGELAIGARVVVPLGRGNTATAGYVIELMRETELDETRIKAIESEAHKAAMPRQLIELAKWISSYYCCPIGMTLSAMMPAAVKKQTGLVGKTMIDLSSDLSNDLKLPAKQRHVVDVLSALPSNRRPVEIRVLKELAELGTLSAIKQLIEKKVLNAKPKTTIEAAWIQQTLDTTIPDKLTNPQSKIIDDISLKLNKGFSAHLLFGVTGSGKTEVYIRLIQAVIAKGKMAIVLVPEIALTPQTGGRLIGRFPDHRVAILHSGLTAAQRNQQWMMAAKGEAEIVLGARSAIFAPIPDDRLGIIIVDEEHDGSYKQDQLPRYHGRDVAIRRAQLAKCPVLLGSATPSLESWYNATVKNSYTIHRLEKRVPGLRLPLVKIVDFAAERKRRDDRRVHLIGPVLENAIGETLDRNGQVIILLNRRGYANYIACPDHRCGWLMACDDCDSTMVFHINRNLRGGGFVRCHHCEGELRLPERCPDCDKQVTTFGLGTQRVEEELARKFPQLVDGSTMLRVDSDSMSGVKDLHDALGRFGDEKIKLLVGTQMIAKGLDFPKVQLVGVINADTALNLPDFRAAERTHQLVSQVAGRCGRGDGPSLVIVQTFQPDAASIKLAAAHDYESFAKLELAERTRCKLPPITRMARLVVRDVNYPQCVSTAKRIASRLRQIASEAVRLRGPAPCPISRIAGKHRQQIELLADSPILLQELLVAGRNQGLLHAGAGLVVDVDPIALL